MTLRKRIAWSIFLGIPLLTIAFVGMFASLIGWDWLNDTCVRWFDSIWREDQ